MNNTRLYWTGKRPIMCVTPPRVYRVYIYLLRYRVGGERGRGRVERGERGGRGSMRGGGGRERERGVTKRYPSNGCRLGMRLLCRHSFGHNRHVHGVGIYNAGIIGWNTVLYVALQRRPVFQVARVSDEETIVPTLVLRCIANCCSHTIRQAEYT